MASMRKLTKKDAQAFAQAYFQTLHGDEQRGGKFIFAPENDKHLLYAQNVENAKDTCCRLLNNYKNNSIFTTINSFHSSSFVGNAKELRKEEYLWGMDTIMIDIDGCKTLMGWEHPLLVALLKYTEKDSVPRIPKPVAYSISGGGGIHLYFSFYRLPGMQMKDSVKCIKYLLAEKIAYILKNDIEIPSAATPYGNVCHYKIDTKVFDNQRYDRLPGSIHPKTGKMVEFYPLDDGIKYEWEELVEIVNDSNIPFSAKFLIPKVQESINDIMQDGFSERLKKGCIHKKKKEKAHKVNDKKAPVIGKARKNHLLELAKKGKDFYGCRETACFLMSNFCLTEGITYEERVRMVNQLNEYFYEPLKQSEINAILREDTIYKFKNATIASMLSLTKDEYKIMFKSKNTGKKKQEMKARKIEIAQLWLDGIKIKDIASRLNISESKVKHTQRLIKRSGGYIFWSVGCNVKKYQTILKKIIEKLKAAKADSLFSVSKKSSFSLISIFSIDIFKAFVPKEFSVVNSHLGRSFPLIS